MAENPNIKMRANGAGEKAKNDQLHSALSKWASDDMKFHAQSGFKLPSQEDFKFLCSGPLVDVWKYVTKHVKSVQTAQLVKGNVELQRRIVEPCRSEDAEERERRQALRQHRSRVARNLAQARGDLAQLRRELGHATQELAAAELSYQSASERVRDLHTRASLLQVVQGTAAATQARYEEYTSRIDSCVQAIKDKKENCEETFVCDSGPEGDVGLDTESCHMVKQACEHIGDLIHCSLETEAKSAQLEMRKSDAIDKVERAVAVYSSQALLRALSMNADQAAAALRQKTSTLDISKDAQEISFSYTPREGLHDLSSPPSTADTVKRLLQTSCEQHVLRWFKEQEHRNDEWKLSSRHTETMAQIDKLLVRVIGDHPAHLESAKSLVLAQVGRAEQQAVAPCLRRELVQLSERVAEAQSNRDELQCKYARIQDFQALVSRKQASISQLAKLNAAAPERLQSHRQQVLDYLDSRCLRTHLAEVEALTLRAKGALISELDAFLGLVLPCLLTVAVDSHTRLCALDLSISPTVHALAHDKSQTYADVCRALEFPLHKSAECLPVLVLDLHASHSHLLAHERRRHSTALAALTAAGQSLDLGTFIGLKEVAVSQDRVQRQKLVSPLREASELARQQSVQVDSLRKTVTTWWDQPAQWATPWVRSSGLTFDQWMQRWRTAMTHVHSKLAARGAPRT